MSTDLAQTPGEGGMPAAWLDYIAPFAAAIGKTVEDVTSSLKGLVGDPGEQAIDVLKSEEYSSFEDIAQALASLNIAKGVLKKAVGTNLRTKVSDSSQAVAVAASGTSFDILPTVPNDESWLNALKVGGRLKVDVTTVTAAMRAALAERSGLFELPARLSDRMEQHAKSLDEPVGPDYFTLSNLLTRRNYAEIFSALGIDGRRYATQGKKAELVTQLNMNLWPALIGFQGQLKAWMESWQQSFSNPAATMGFITASISGRAGILPPGMTSPPPTDALRDGADGVINQINRCFAGTAIPVVMAMAYDAQAIKEVLSNPSLPANVGAANYDQMLKQLNVDVSADYVRLEHSVTRFALAVMELPKIAPEAELAYLSALLMLGSQIPWDRLGAPSRRKGASVYPTVESDDDYETESGRNNQNRRNRS